jgi:hypothetical protein
MTFQCSAIAPSDFNLAYSRDYLKRFEGLTCLEFLGARPSVISPPGYAVKLSWTLFFRDSSTGALWSLPEYPASYRKVDSVDASHLLQNKWLPLSYCSTHDISTTNVFTAYVRKEHLIRIV